MNAKWPKTIAVGILAMGMIILACATHTAMGPGSETIAIVVGRVVDSLGQPAPQTLVMLLPAQYDPLTDPAISDSMLGITDETGHYAMKAPGPGAYSVEAADFNSNCKALATGINVGGKDTVPVSVFALHRPGALRVVLQDTVNETSGYIYLTGTTCYAHAHNGIAMIDAVPAGSIPAVYYANTSAPSRNHILQTNLTVQSNDTLVIADITPWKYSKKLYLNTTAGGANIAQNVYNFPVLLRFTTSNFDFSQAKSDGSDIRITKSNGAPLPFEIERWDAVSGLAEVWVKVDTVYGKDSAYFFIMYWGNSSAMSASNGAAVFDTADGFQGVWHLAGAGNASARDATLHHYDGTPTDTAPQAIPGIIGTALQFDGKASGLVMKNTASGPLNFPRPGTYTFSAWVSVDTVIDDDEFIAGKGHDQYALRIKGRTSVPANMFALHEYIDAPVYGTDIRYAPVVTQQWKYIVGIRNAARSYLYIDGACVDSTGMVVSGWKSVQDSTSFSIGRCGAPFNGNDYLPFMGEIDEVRIGSVAVSADWVKLCYMNQKAGDLLIKFEK